MIRALVVDDDALSRAYLRHLLNAHGNVRVMGEAASLEEGRDLLRRVESEIAFVAVALGRDCGFELMAHVSPGVRVIFIAAHAHSALRAFEVNALDYLVKPVTPARLAAALARRQPRPPETMLRTDDVMHLRDGHRSRITRIADICAIAAQENYSRVHHVDGSNILVRRPLKSWEDILPSARFLRIHRTGIVNLAHLRSYRRDSSGGVIVEVHTLAQPMPVGRTFWPALKARFAPAIDSASPFLARRRTSRVPRAADSTESPGRRAG